MKKLDVKTLIEEGYLQEANRLFFNPLGLELRVELSNACDSVLFIVDNREFESGILLDYIDSKKVYNVLNKWKIKQKTRYEKYGFNVQPEYPRTSKR